MRYFIAGGAGFIGSHLARALIADGAEILVYDNFSSGKEHNLKTIKDHISIIHGDVKDLGLLSASMKEDDIVYHFASNPDISKAAAQPDIDFWEGTYLTNNILEAMRRCGAKKLLYASGSGVYGEAGSAPVKETGSDMRPVSTYGASKLACESMICAYSYMFGIDAAAFRFANVVGPNQTHGVGYDFVNKLLKNSEELYILGDGRQDKPYIYVDDVISAVRMVEAGRLSGFDVYNVAVSETVSVNAIADIAEEILGLSNVKRLYSGGDRGWKGDVPVIRLDFSKIRALGWNSRYGAKEALYMSISAMYNEAMRASE
ncbi:MAG: NAD-dependent epimerase/dehydratase family protein [Clostridiales bacterium]|jgi:UDP-glucose 4-epimerase|nr:NAD-dependent epimerase/dehydratase family protein [Clostridiales bacterium]